MLREGLTYEHIEPEAVGNQRWQALVSDLSGRSKYLLQARREGLKENSTTRRKGLLERIKEMERTPLASLESAEGSFELWCVVNLKPNHFLFDLEKMTIITEKRGSGRTEHRAELVVRASPTAALGRGSHPRRTVRRDGEVLAGVLEGCLSQGVRRKAHGLQGACWTATKAQPRESVCWSHGATVTKRGRRSASPTMCWRRAGTRCATRCG
ncbi:MAG: hypothetical protein R2724_27420 [Bryobacterales bacterium]